jgi:hypothetical protein
VGGGEKMTEQEFATGIIMLEDNYKGFSIMANKRAADTWYEMLKDLSCAEFIDCIKKHLATIKFQPTIASIREMASSGLTEMEAWSKVKYAICHSAYGAKEQWEKLPLEAQAMYSPQDLERLATTEGLNLEVEGSNFMRSYKQKVKTVNEQMHHGRTESEAG